MEFLWGLIVAVSALALTLFLAAREAGADIGSSVPRAELQGTGDDESIDMEQEFRELPW